LRKTSQTILKIIKRCLELYIAERQKIFSAWRHGKKVYMAKGTEAGRMAEKLFPKFGELTSAEEINRAAEAQKKEGDFEALKTLAKENGIDEMDAQDYMDDISSELCTDFSAAIGKIQREVEYLKPSMTLEAWNTFLYGMLAGENAGADSDSIKLCRAVRSKGKYLAGFYARVIVECSKNRVYVPKVIVDEAKKLDKDIPDNLPMGDISRLRLEELIREYYFSK